MYSQDRSSREIRLVSRVGSTDNKLGYERESGWVLRTPLDERHRLCEFRPGNVEKLFFALLLLYVNRSLRADVEDLDALMTGADEPSSDP